MLCAKTKIISQNPIVRGIATGGSGLAVPFLPTLLTLLPTLQNPIARGIATGGSGLALASAVLAQVLLCV